MKHDMIRIQKLAVECTCRSIMHVINLTPLTSDDDKRTAAARLTSDSVGGHQWDPWGMLLDSPLLDELFPR